MGKILNYKILGTALKSLSDACFKADEQQRNGEKVTACGMSDDDLDRLCDIIPNMLNPMMSTEEVKEALKHHLSIVTKLKKEMAKEEEQKRALLDDYLTNYPDMAYKDYLAMINGQNQAKKGGSKK